MSNINLEQDNYFIDWLSCVIQIPHYTNNGLGLGGDRYIKFDPKSGDVIYEGRSTEPVLGSFDTAIIVKSQIETYDQSGQYDQLYISGNLGKFINGHNLWGSNDLQQLLIQTLYYLSSHENIDIEYKIRPELIIKKGLFKISRIDVTTQFECGENEKSVEKWLTVAAKYAHAKYKGHGTFKNQTLRFGASRRSSYKFYGKYREVIDNYNFQSLFNIDIVDYVQNHLRYEVTIRTTQLLDLDCHKGHTYNFNKLVQFANKQLNNLVLPTNVNLSVQDVTNLKPSTRLAYRLLCDGHPLKTQPIPRSTYFRIKKELLEAGINPDVIPDKSSEYTSLESVFQKPAHIHDEIMQSLSFASPV